MKNHRSILRHTLAVSLLATASQVVLAGELGGLAGTLDGYHNLSLNYKTSTLWQGTLAAHPVDLSLEYSLGMVQAPAGLSKRNLANAGVTPFGRWWFAPNTGAELGVGANMFSGARLGNKDISTAFQFGSSLGVFHRIEGSPWLVGLRLTHYSNAGIKEPNPGQSYVQLKVSYTLP